MNKQENWQKIIAIISFGSLIIALLIAHSHPATSYELDIYASTPTIVWILIFFGLLGGASIILYQVIKKDQDNSKIWLIGLLIIILSRMVLLFLPYTRDYMSWRGDNIDYLGMVKDILFTGHFPIEDFYPVTNVFLSTIIQVTGISDRIVANLSTTLISILFILFTYMFVGAITHDKRKQKLSTVIAGIVMLTGLYNVILAPNGWSILFMPLLFFLYFKSQKSNYRILLLIVLIAYPFFHPLSSLAVIVVLLIFELIRQLFSSFQKKGSEDLSIPSKTSVYLIIELIIFSVWILAHPNFGLNLRLVWQQLTEWMAFGKLTQLGESINKLDLHGFDLYYLIFKMYGAEIILLVLSGIGILYFLKRILKNNMVEEGNAFFCLTYAFMFYGLLYLAYLIGLPGIGVLAEGQGDRRLLGYVDILIPLFSVSIFYALLFTVKFRNLARVTIVGLLILSSILSVVSLYNSPYIYRPNIQITSSHMTGTKWFINRKDSDIQCTYIMSSPNNIVSGIIGFSAANERTDIKNSIQLNDHFGYPEYPSLGTQYHKDAYVIITTFDRTIYSTVWRQLGRFTAVDFEKLELDSTVSKLYSNGGMDIYYIQYVADR